jgi:DNA-binding transcriptional MerR regulator
MLEWMFTVSQLARRCGLSRSTVLYYEAIGLLKAARRTNGNYRSYSDRDLERLQQVCAYRKAGLRLKDIAAILDRRDGDSAAVLKRRLLELDAEIETKREHQKAILLLLRGAAALKGKKEMMTKEKWVSIMRSAGLSDGQMHRWHVEFEKSAPEDHQVFLESLHIPAEEIEKIRAWSRSGQAHD